MEKRISYSDFQQVKSVAKACDPSIRERNKIKAKIEKLVTDYKREEQKISMLEAGIKNIIGFNVEQLVKKVIETDSKGNKVTKYLPTDIVTYDDTAKQYVITVPDETPTTESQPGSDFDKDAESSEGETLTEEEAKIEEEAAMIEPDGEDLPFGPTNEDEEF